MTKIIIENIYVRETKIFYAHIKNYGVLRDNECPCSCQSIM